MFEAVIQIKYNKASDPNGFPTEFCKNCWHIIKDDFLSMFHDLFNGHFQLFHLNFGTIMLLSKKEEAVHIEQFRPICLLNVSFIFLLKSVQIG